MQQPASLGLNESGSGFGHLTPRSRQVSFSSRYVSHFDWLRPLPADQVTSQDLQTLNPGIQGWVSTSAKAANVSSFQRWLQLFAALFCWQWQSMVDSSDSKRVLFCSCTFSKERASGMTFRANWTLGSLGRTEDSWVWTSLEQNLEIAPNATNEKRNQSKFVWSRGNRFSVDVAQWLRPWTPVHSSWLQKWIFMFLASRSFRKTLELMFDESKTDRSVVKFYVKMDTHGGWSENFFPVRWNVISVLNPDGRKKVGIFLRPGRKTAFLVRVKVALLARVKVSPNIYLGRQKAMKPRLKEAFVRSFILSFLSHPSMVIVWQETPFTAQDTDLGKRTPAPCNSSCCSGFHF